MPPAKKRNLRATKVDTSKRARKKPRCRLHGSEMGFDPARLLWTCPEENCTMVAHPKDDAGGARSVAFSGEFDLYKVYKDGNEYILVRQNKMAFDLSQHVTGVNPTKAGVFVTLNFDNMIEVNGDTGEIVSS